MGRERGREGAQEAQKREGEKGGKENWTAATENMRNSARRDHIETNSRVQHRLCDWTCSSGFKKFKEKMRYAIYDNIGHY